MSAANLHKHSYIQTVVHTLSYSGTRGLLHLCSADTTEINGRSHVCAWMNARAQLRARVCVLSLSLPPSFCSMSAEMCQWPNFSFSPRQMLLCFQTYRRMMWPSVCQFSMVTVPGVPLDELSRVGLFSLLYLFWKKEVGVCLHHAVCIPLINFRMLEPIFMTLRMYIMAPEPISTAYFMNPSHQSVCLHVYSPSLLGNGSVKTSPRQRIHATAEELLDAIVFYAVRVVSNECRRFVLPRTYCFSCYLQIYLSLKLFDDGMTHFLFKLSWWTLSIVRVY
jgi:hypothetical protein